MHERLSGLSAHQAEMPNDVPEPRGATDEASAARLQDAQHVRVAIRRSQVKDILALSRISSRYEMNHPGSSRTESDPARATLRGVLPFARNDQPVFVATTEEDRRILGFAQFRVVGPDQRWLAESMGANAGIYDPEPVVSELLHHAIKAAGLDGVKRLYAKVEPNSPLKESLRQNGFTPYTRERVMAASTVPVMAAAQGVRVQEQADVWAIHQLYLHSTPREVQYAEALTSHSWDVDAVLRSSGCDCRGWLVADDYLAVGYMRAISRRDAHVIDFMVSSEHRDVFPLLIATAFRELAALSSRRVYVVIRDYQSEFIPFLYELGFGIELAQEVHIRYTTASVRSSVMAGSYYAADAKKEPSARRVPTFFQGPVDSYQMRDDQDEIEDWHTEVYGAFEQGE
jgi:hypothetical protein